MGSYFSCSSCRQRHKIYINHEMNDSRTQHGLNVWGRKHTAPAREKTPITPSSMNIILLTEIWGWVICHAQYRGT
jgi:hypothetical protein